MNKNQDKHTRIAIVGAGPGALFLYKRLIESGITGLSVDIFEKKPQPGAGMPYSSEGANTEHVTNVSGNEIPGLVTTVAEWVKIAPAELLAQFNLDPHQFNDYQVLPRLLFGEYLSAQFALLRDRADKAGIVTRVHLCTYVTDIADNRVTRQAEVHLLGKDPVNFDRVIIATGHFWPLTHEGKVPGYYDSPYPPAKLAQQLDHPVAIRGASLTAFDALRTLARNNGVFEEDENGNISFKLSPKSAGFKLVMHSTGALLPAIRLHMADSHLNYQCLLTPEEIDANIAKNDGFLSLDFLFEKDFKESLRNKDPEFYQHIRHMSLETFVNEMMEPRRQLDPFQLFRAEFAEAELSIAYKRPVHWKEMLAVLSFAMNYPAKHFPAEDMVRLQKVLMPLISIVIAFAPQSSAKELLALRDAGVLDLIPVGSGSHVDPQDKGGIVYHFQDRQGQPQAVHYQTFVDCIGQPHLSCEDFPFKSLVESGTVSQARISFRSDNEGRKAMVGGNKKVKIDRTGRYYLEVPGITISDQFQVVDAQGDASDRIFIMAVPYIGGYNPDYSGLDFCEEASGRIVAALLGNR
ncbi:FAD/NAD(P)-binding protein [Hufsiella ginkgonis]|uniref:FAD-dependent urate hydroxylase HpyO/Asp monooxygenase CreE-like FAD/NAD(P)-binding domain-containing protein n=1 Tax=Hufsiella ginkgonis TaxID=2695274 RepID=A0A7K1XVQ6_9SPHI|nr:FAD/NAD(P)-binding protein [Hufsiella ginkgonis]MXV15062.1 hypothetical protein [Hufsiella ginkgonis]